MYDLGPDMDAQNRKFGPDMDGVCRHLAFRPIIRGPPEALTRPRLKTPSERLRTVSEARCTGEVSIMLVPNKDNNKGNL